MLDRITDLKYLYPLLIIPILISCNNQELTVTAKLLFTDQNIECPPICMEGPTDSDTPSPLSFKICFPDDDCLQIESGKSIIMSSSVTVKAPDGESPGEQLPTLEEGVFLKFDRWSDGNTDNPRTIAMGDAISDLVAYYDISVPQAIGTTASSRGCGNIAGIITGLSSSWAPVVDTPNYHIVQGPVMSSRVSDEDLYTIHESNDLNMWILLSEREQVKMLSSKNGQLGNRPGQIEVELESGSIPTWAWPSEEVPDKEGQPDVSSNNADIAWIKGVWIFDCGHQDSEISHGAWTEIHPPIATAVMRGTRNGKLFLKQDISEYFPDLNELATGIEGVQVDLWLNEDVGEGAAKSVQCAMALANNQGCIFDQVLDINDIHEFDIPLPPPPDGLDPAAVFRIKVLRLQEGQPEPEITQIVSNGVRKLHVKLDLTDYNDTWRTCTLQNELYNQDLINCQGNAYGATIIAGWEIFKNPADLNRVRLMVHNLQLFGDYETEGGNGEYKIWLDLGPGAAFGGDPLNSSHIALHKINKDLTSAPGEGESYPLYEDGSPLTFYFNIRENNPESNRIRIFLNGYEQDAIWDDDLNNLERIFYKDDVFWEVAGVSPSWAPSSYGEEKMFGAFRAGTSPPISYEDGIFGESSVPSFNHRLDYFMEEIELE